VGVGVLVELPSGGGLVAGGGAVAGEDGLLLAEVLTELVQGWRRRPGRRVVGRRRSCRRSRGG
jgi:hypothetical protein